MKKEEERFLGMRGQKNRLLPGLLSVGLLELSGTYSDHTMALLMQLPLHPAATYYSVSAGPQADSEDVFFGPF